MKNDSLAIYLDQNHWMYLAQAYHNHPQGEEHKAILEKLQSLVSEEKVFLPLSVYHFLETLKRQDKGSRDRLAEALSTLSRGWKMALLDDVTPIEIQIAGAKLFNLPVPKRPKVFGRDLSLIFGIDVHTLANKIAQENGEIFNNAQLAEILSGYKAGISHFAELNKMVRSYHKLSGSSQVQQENAFISDYIADPDTRRILNTALSIYNKSIDDIISMGTNSVVEFVEGIPTLDLESKLFALRNVQWDRKIAENDWADLRALVVAVPYCDIVVTERLWHNLLQRINFEKNTKLLC